MLPLKRSDDDLRRRQAIPASILFRQLLRDPLSLRRYPKLILIGVLSVLALIFYVSVHQDKRQYHAVLNLSAEPLNWGDHVGLGLGRVKMLESTPSPYADLGDKWIGGSGPLYRARRAFHEDSGVLKPGSDVSEGRIPSLGRDAEFERDRHGVMGGASTEWSAGVVGSGVWLGDEVDMRKESPSISPLQQRSALPARQALTQHIMDEAWLYLDEEDEKNTVKLLADAKNKNFMDKLPLRDQVRGDPHASLEAALSWSRVYGAMEEEWKKSALEVAIEKLVRRAPVVVFSMTSCPYAKQAKSLLNKHRISPEPHIVEVDLRPDGSNLRSLLIRRTLHLTLPNIVIGSRSIGGADDLQRLDQNGELKSLLLEVGVQIHNA